MIVPWWRDPPERPPEALLLPCARPTGAAHASSACAWAPSCSPRPACSTAGPPRRTGRWADSFAARYSGSRLDPDVLYVDDGDVLTSAGTAAGIDCCLHLLRTLHGADAAERVARRMVVAPHRQGGQAQYIEQPVPQSRAGDRLSGVLEWAARAPGPAAQPRRWHSAPR